MTSEPHRLRPATGPITVVRRDQNPGGLGPLTGVTFDAVLFDLDGTLVDSLATVERCWAQLFSEFRLDPAAMAHVHGVPAAQSLQTLIPDDPTRRDRATRRIIDLEIAAADDTTMLPGAAEALAVLPRDRSAIVTSGTRDLAEARIAGAGLSTPPVLVCAGDTPAGKPAPDPFLLAARLLGVDPARCLVVEDAVGGLAAAQAAGCRTLAVLPQLSPGEPVADAEVDDLAAVHFVVDGAAGTGPSQ
jgi:sugar-phosphatase